MLQEHKSVKENIQFCEKAYIESFSKTFYKNGFLEFNDELIKDMYDHNFIYLPNGINKEKITEIINENLIKAEQAGFLKVVFEMDYEAKEIEKISEKTIKKMLATKHGIYELDMNKVSEWKQKANCTIKKMNSQQDINDAINMTIKTDGESLGEDFCTRKIKRKAQVYMQNESIENYLIYYNNELIGSCEAFINDNVAKLEELGVLPNYQKMGFATTLLKYIVDELYKKGVEIIYLNTDEDDTVKEMYVKLGFSKTSGKHMLLWADWMEQA